MTAVKVRQVATVVDAPAGSNLSPGDEIDIETTFEGGRVEVRTAGKHTRPDPSPVDPESPISPILVGVVDLWLKNVRWLGDATHGPSTSFAPGTIGNMHVLEIDADGRVVHATFYPKDSNGFGSTLRPSWEHVSEDGSATMPPGVPRAFDKLAALESAQEAVVAAAGTLSDKTDELMIDRTAVALGCYVVERPSYMKLREAVVAWRRASDAATAQARGDDDASVAGAWRINVPALRAALRAIREHREIVDLATRDLPKPTRERSSGLEITIDALAEIVEDDWRPRGEPTTLGGRPSGPVGLTGEFRAPTLGPDYKCPVKDCAHDHSKTWQAPPGSLGCILHDEEVMRRLSTNVRRWVGR
jgi:hypothetical protein